jgi:DNA-binding HxlR family transcriptional regulator
MHAKRIDPKLAQRAIVLQVLRDDHPEKWMRVELEQSASDIEPLTVSDALAKLETEGVVILDGETVTASRCARHLDALGLIGV